MRNLSVVFAMIFCATLSVMPVLAEDPPLVRQDNSDILLSRAQINAQLDARLTEALQEDIVVNHPRKSVGRAVVFSAVLPGAGQLYSGSYWKAAAFLAVEATAWYMNVAYNRKGKDKDTEFRAYAAENWSEQRYWSHVYHRIKDRDDISLPASFYQEDFLVLDSQNRELIDDWEAAELILVEYATGTYLPGYTHHLPETKTQQYYEMIGKYPEQFGNAWDDADFLSGRYSGYDGGVITPQNKTYAVMRDESNRLYRVAGYGSMIALANHLFSAIDAGFTARRLNRFKLTYNSRQIQNEYINYFGMSVAF